MAGGFCRGMTIDEAHVVRFEQEIEEESAPIWDQEEFEEYPDEGEILVIRKALGLTPARELVRAVRKCEEASIVELLETTQDQARSHPQAEPLIEESRDLFPVELHLDLPPLREVHQIDLVPGTFLPANFNVQDLRANLLQQRESDAKLIDDRKVLEQSTSFNLLEWIAEGWEADSRRVEQGSWSNRVAGRTGQLLESSEPWPSDARLIDYQAIVKQYTLDSSKVVEQSTIHTLLRGTDREVGPIVQGSCRGHYSESGRGTSSRSHHDILGLAEKPWSNSEPWPGESGREEAWSRRVWSRRGTGRRVTSRAVQLLEKG